MLLQRGIETRADLRDVLPCAAQYLSAVRLVLANYHCYLGVLVVEDFTKEEDGSFHGREPLQKDQEGHGEGFVHVGDFVWIATSPGQQRLGQPLADILFTLHAYRLQMVDAKPANDSHQERPW